MGSTQATWFTRRLDFVSARFCFFPSFIGGWRGGLWCLLLLLLLLLELEVLIRVHLESRLERR